MQHDSIAPTGAPTETISGASGEEVPSSVEPMVGVCHPISGLCLVSAAAATWMISFQFSRLLIDRIASTSTYQHMMDDLFLVVPVILHYHPLFITSSSALRNMPLGYRFSAITTLVTCMVFGFIIDLPLPLPPLLSPVSH